MNSTAPDSTAAVDRYYQLHAGIYDLTRWAFLFGRHGLISHIEQAAAPTRILEIGCGTGHLLRSLAQRFPQAHLTGVDLSAPMLAVAADKVRPWADRVELKQAAYQAPLRGTNDGFDLVVCSYSLSMFNPGWQQAVRTAFDDMKCGGLFAMVDFHASDSAAFRRWMRLNHVRMDGHLIPELEQLFQPLTRRVEPAYLGLWEYAQFVGQKKSPAPLPTQVGSVRRVAKR